MDQHRYLLQTRLSQVLRTTKSHLETLKSLGIETVEDFLYFFPRSYRDRTEIRAINEIRTDELNVVKGKLSKLFTRRTRTGKFMTVGELHDGTGVLHLMWFNQPHIQRMFRNGDEVVLTGKVKFERARMTMLSPQYEIQRKQQIHSGKLVPVYHQRDNVTSKWIREKINPLLKGSQLLEGFLPGPIVEQYGLLPYGEAVRVVHDPKDEELLERARHRLAFEELFLLQLSALRRRERFRQARRDQDRMIKVNSQISEQFFSSIGFELTGAQNRVIQEISEDLNSPYPMLRLLQGDVGAGKTAVAAFSLLQVLHSEFQGCLMAPTEILARQHYAKLTKLMVNFGFNVQLLVGSLKESEKQRIKTQIATGTVDLVIGTHALIQEDVRFARLGLAVIDEQHRFGVKQREKLHEHKSPHVLSLSATPIPRTLAMVMYGDQEVSILDELPPGRQEIVTRIVPEKKRQDAELWVADQIGKGRQVYIICPLVEDSDVLEVKSVTTEFERLEKGVFPQFKLGLLHGRLRPDEKDAVMTAFSDGELDILVSTSVVEVGIDVPNATIMIIEGADRFGLSQLHQFRGRVGRGKHQSYCFLFTDSNGQESMQRLNSLVKYSDGFKLAEIDLALRGPGEVYGVKQSGIPDLKMASLGDTELIQTVRNAAMELLAADPTLELHWKLRDQIDQMEAQKFSDDSTL